MRASYVRGGGGLALAVFVLACGGAAPAAVFDNADARAVVVGDGAGGVATLMPSGETCLDVGPLARTDDQCVKPQEKCGESGRADIIVDSEGRYVDTICYPSVVQDTEVVDGAPVDSVQVGNKTAILIDGVADGDDITGDVKINGNNSYIFGQGADVSVIAGNVEINKNNAGVRGVRIKGNYIVEFNNATLVLGVVEGNVIIRGNNAVIAETVVLGNIEISGNNTVLVGNYVKGNIEITGKNTRCDNNRAFVDANDDKLYQPGEEGTVLTCGG